MTWVIVAVPLVTAGLVAVIAVVFTFSASRRARPELGPRPLPPASSPAPVDTGTAPPPRPGAVDGTWHAMVAGGGLIGAMGGTLNGIFGRLDLAGGVLTFTRDGAPDPDWQTPCHAVRIRQLHALVAKGDVEMNGPMGHVRCTVSREHVNRYTRNSFKDIREQGYAREFVGAVLSNGATHG